MHVAIGVKKERHGGRAGDLMQSLTKDKGEVLQITIADNIMDENFFTDASQTVVDCGEGCVKIITRTCELSRTGPFEDLCSRIGNMFYSQDISDQICEMNNMPSIPGKWYATFNLYPRVHDMRKAGIKEYILNLPNSESIRAGFVIPVNQYNEELSLINGTVVQQTSEIRAMSGSNTINVIPPSLMRCCTLKASTLPTRRINRTDSSYVCVVIMTYIMEGKCNPEAILGVQRKNTVEPKAIMTLCAKSKKNENTSVRAITQEDGKVVLKRVKNINEHDENDKYNFDVTEVPVQIVEKTAKETDDLFVVS